MAEAKDPAIKLFGKTIPLPDTPPPPSAAVAAAVEEEAAVGSSCTADDVMELTSADRNDDEDDDNNTTLAADDVAPEERESSGGGDKDDQDGNSSHTKQSGVSPQVSDKTTCQDPLLETADNPETLSGADEKVEAEPSKSEEEKMETDVSQEKTLKKPDKILPCPRCNSMDTKFCYYNNYNVNQPRHFCKKCQRYWTAGGTMRNVPVGAGRRKNKSSASQYRQITVPDALQSSRSDMPNGIHPGLQTKGTVLTFGSDSPLCESMASILNIAEKTMRSCPTANGFQKPEELKIQVPIVALETGCQVDGSNLENPTKSSPKDSAPQNCVPFPAQIPCYPGAPWPYPWNSAQWSPPVAAPPFCPNGIALPFYPAPAYWGCTVPGAWSIPWIAQPSPASQSAPNSSPNSPTLGKHSRDGNVLTSTSSEEKASEDKGAERSLWIPKTLRIDDPGEAAKSSIWTTLGIKHNEKPESIGRGSGLFKAFQSKSDERNPNVETSTVLEANPAALSRSQNFQENS